MCTIQVEYLDKRIEVKEVKRWFIQDGCLVTQENFGDVYVPLSNIRKFIPNCNDSIPGKHGVKIG